MGASGRGDWKSWIYDLLLKCDNGADVGLDNKILTVKFNLTTLKSLGVIVEPPFT